jgi:hypothetical protein
VKIAAQCGCHDVAIIVKSIAQFCENQSENVKFEQVPKVTPPLLAQARKIFHP